MGGEDTEQQRLMVRGEVEDLINVERGPTRGGGTQSRNHAEFFLLSRIHAMRGKFGFSRIQVGKKANHASRRPMGGSLERLR